MTMHLLPDTLVMEDVEVSDKIEFSNRTVHYEVYERQGSQSGVHLFSDLAKARQKKAQLQQNPAIAEAHIRMIVQYTENSDA